MQQINSMTSSSWTGTVKEEFDEKQYTGSQNTFRCSHCSGRYPNSRLLVQHMHAEHLHSVEARIAQARMAGVSEKVTSQSNNEKYKNSTAICPFCHYDCHTRKKLMRHLEVEHKDDNEQDGPNLKVIRIESLDEGKKKDLLSQLSNTGPFVTPNSSQSKIVQNLLKAFGTSSSTFNTGSSKVDNKTTNKLPYKCFWCEASFRKRGKLMDHIDTLHKDNKQQNQAEADRLSVSDPNKSPFSRPMLNHHSMSLSQLDIPKYSSGILGFMPMASPIQHRSPLPEYKSSTNKCSFTLVGSLISKPNQPTEEPIRSNICKFYLRKKDNPLAQLNHRIEMGENKLNPTTLSLPPNMLESRGNSTSQFNFPYRMMQPASTMAAAMQQTYMINMRSPLLDATQFYAPRMPMMIPSSDYLVNPSQAMLEHQSQSTSQAQLFARMNHVLAQMSPLTQPKSSESPLDLTKSHIQ